MYELFVREGVLKASAEMEMILTGVGHERQKKIDANAEHTTEY